MNRQMLSGVFLCFVLAFVAGFVVQQSLVADCSGAACICANGHEAACSDCGQSAGFGYSYEGTRCSESCDGSIMGKCECTWKLCSRSAAPYCGLYISGVKCPVCTDECAVSWELCPCEWI